MNRGRKDGVSGFCAKHENERKNRYYLQYRAEVFELLGNRCAIPECPNDDPRGWEIDHVNGGGGVERRTVVGSSTRKWVEMIKADPSRYQILCAYHNRIKKIENNEVVGARIYTRQVPTEWRPPPNHPNRRVDSSTV